MQSSYIFAAVQITRNPRNELGHTGSSASWEITWAMDADLGKEMRQFCEHVVKSSGPLTYEGSNNFIVSAINEPIADWDTIYYVDNHQNGFLFAN